MGCPSSCPPSEQASTIAFYPPASATEESVEPKYPVVAPAKLAEQLGQAQLTPTGEVSADSGVAQGSPVWAQ